MFNAFFATSQAARVPPAPVGKAEPKFKKDCKVIALGVLIEAGISGRIFFGAWENAQVFAPGNPVLMLLAPYLCVVLEFTKVPVGLLSQTHPSAVKRAVAAGVLLLAAMSTAINAVPIFAKMWKPQLAAVRQADENLAVAVADQASFNRNMLAASRLYKETQESRRTASAGVGELASRHDSSRRALTSDLADARKDVGEQKKKLDAANKALARFDPKKTGDAVRAAEAALRKARQASTLHWIYGAATGAEVSGVTGAQLAPLMIGGVGMPAVLVAVVSSLLSALGVTRIRLTAQVKVSRWRLNTLTFPPPWPPPPPPLGTLPARGILTPLDLALPPRGEVARAPPPPAYSRSSSSSCAVIVKSFGR